MHGRASLRTGQADHAAGSLDELSLRDNGSQPSSDVRIHRLPVPHSFLAAQPVIGGPTFDVSVEFLNTSEQRLPPVAWSHLLQPGFDSLHRFAREMKRPLLLLVPAEPKPKEMDLLRSSDRTLFRVDEQSQPLFEKVIAMEEGPEFEMSEQEIQMLANELLK